MASTALSHLQQAAPAQLSSLSGRPLRSSSPPTGLGHAGLPLFAVRAKQRTDPLPQTKKDVKSENKEPLRIFDNTPAGMFFRPESERRPEEGNTDPGSVMRFDGPAPETINSRLAMVGIVWALGAELVSGQSLVQQVTQGSGFIWFLLVAPVFIWATLVPIFGRGESPDSRQAGPFRAKAERWNGRAAMIGIVALLLTEQFLLKGAPLLGSFSQH
ncbi:hypothetical protein L7F22_054670 [Adiantum nelumboides]|nr:hypothetical protein [Adiantum nelumboides]MCO5578493.1 hypothetical protein [Adiantum nelumboides]MCO5600556.1 hypothetical protein [Adiantum nelumboides]